MSEGQWSRLANTTVTYAGGTPDRSKEAYFGGSIPWVKSTEVNLGKIFATEETLSELGFASSAAKWIPANTVLVALYGATAAQVGFLTFRATANQAVLAVVANNDLDSTFLFYALTEAKERLLFLAQGSGQPNLNKQIVDNLRLRIPPLAQQRKIARILTTLDSLIEKTESLIAKYQSIKQGMMADLFTRGVDANGKLRPPQSAAPELYKQSELGWIPKEWEVCRVDEVGAVKLGRQRSPDQHSGKHTTPYLRVANVFDGWIDYSDVLEMDFTPTERETFLLIRNDILLNEGQSLELVGRSSMYLGEPNRYCFQNTLVRFRCTPENHPTFWQDCFQYGRSIGRFMQIASQTTSVAHLGADRFARMMVVRPALEEQVAIAKRIRSMNGRMVVEEEQRGKLRTWKTGLMQDLLTGKVPVNPDESEEAVR